MGPVQRLLSVLIVLVGLGAAVAIAVVAGRTPLRPTQAELDGLTAILDRRIGEAVATVKSRATSLADLPILASVVATDAATARDLTHAELMFKPHAGEIIGLAQVPREGKPGKPTALLEYPENAAELPWMKTGTHLIVVGGDLLACDVERVEPRSGRGEEVFGTVTIAQRIDLQEVALALGKLGVAAMIDVGDGAVVPGGKAVPKGAPTVPLAIGGDPEHRARLVVEQQGGERSPKALAVAGAIALCGLLIAIGRRRKRLEATPLAAGPASAQLPATPVANLTNAAFANTDIGTPAPDGTRRIGRFEIVRPLGAGGMANVYLARASGEAGFERQIALKVMQQHLTQQQPLVEHFLDEARLVSRLTHPNVVQILDLGKADGEYFIAMEYIDGADLAKLLALSREHGRPVPARVALTIVRKLCEGLHAAHIATDEHGKPLEIVHRDVKSPNVFVSRSGAVKIGDFGIAKANQVGRAVNTEAGVAKGTFAYMAPEHRMGHKVDRRADVFATGAVMYEVLSGNEVNLDLLGLLGKPKEEWPHLPMLKELRPELPADLDAIVKKALAYEREDRYATCLELEEALEQVAEQYGLVGSEKMVAAWVAQELDGKPMPPTGVMASANRTTPSLEVPAEALLQDLKDRSKG